MSSRDGNGWCLALMMEKRCSTRSRHRRQRRFAPLTSFSKENQTDSTVQAPAALTVAGPWQGDLLIPILRKKGFSFLIWPSYSKESLCLEASRNTALKWKRHCRAWWYTCFPSQCRAAFRAFCLVCPALQENSRKTKTKPTNI